MADMTMNRLLNPSNGVDRPESGDADFRAVVAAASSSDDTELALTAASKAPGDHAMPIPWACTTPFELLRWMLIRIIEEEAISTISGTAPVTITRSVTNVADGQITETYTVRMVVSAGIDEADWGTPALIEPLMPEA